MKFCLPLLCLSWLTALPLHAADRIALVIGNNAYTSFPEARQLTSPRADASDVAVKLRAIGFTVLAPVLDGTRAAIVKAKNDFLAQARDAQIALFYFSGHGFQVGEENFLIPSDMPNITSYTVLRDNALMLRDSLMVGLEEAGARTKVIILDCCRDNPFAAQLEKAFNGTNKSLRTKGGTGEITGYGSGFYLAFATSPGTFADDGNGARNSPFTAALLTHLQDKAGENIRDLFDEVKETVREISGEEQVPWTNDSLSKSHLKVLARLVPAAPNTPPAPSSATSVLDTGAVGKVVQVKLPGEVLMKFCWCPPGSFMMGSPKSEKYRGGDEDQVPVRISKGFWMAQTEVTQAQWEAVMGSNPSKFKGTDLPVEMVSWEDAQEMVKKLNASVSLPEGWKYALPSEAQWEYACRAGTESVFHFGDVLDGTQANCVRIVTYGSTPGPLLGKTVKVGSYAPNPWGMHDMHGNVSEWCSDWKGDKLPGGTDPPGPSTDLYRVVRGGSWDRDAARCRAAYRFSHEPGFRYNNVGVRPALVPSR